MQQPILGRQREHTSPTPAPKDKQLQAEQLKCWPELRMGAERTLMLVAITAPKTDAAVGSAVSSTANAMVLSLWGRVQLTLP